MSNRFIGLPPRTDWLRESVKGRMVKRLVHPLAFEYEIDGEKGLVVVPVGFKTDYASIPWIARRALPADGLYTPAAIVHDYLYKKKIGSRKRADLIFKLGMEVMGVNPILRSIMYRSVRLFGRGGWGR